MKIIKDLVCNIKDELHDAEKYYIAAKLADDDILKDTYHYLAEQELIHVDKLHDAAVKEIKKYRAESGEPPAVMIAL